MEPTLQQFAEQSLISEFDRSLDQFLELINEKYNYDFRQYAHASLRRRVVQAMHSMGYLDLESLGEKVLTDSNSFYDLIQCLTVTVSEMFRNPPYYLALREKVVPKLRKYPSLKVWIAGCSTGEEVYSLAILLQEEGLLDRTIIYATDINPRSLVHAERGIFEVDLVRKFTRSYQLSGGKRSLSDYYTAAFGAAKFRDDLKENIIFADHSLATDAVFSEAQLISCRNVLIYFDRQLQDKALGLFHDSLCPQGFLGLGTSETVLFSKHSPQFVSIAEDERIFRKS